MGQAIEFHGRIGRGDGRLSAGRLDLVFRLFPGRDGDGPLWEEAHAGVPVAPTGAFHVVLGLRRPLHAEIFGEAPRWLGVCINDGHAVSEAGERVPVLGTQVQLAEAVAQLAERLDRLDGPVSLPAAEKVDAEARRRVIKLHRRLRAIERGGGIFGPLAARVSTHEARLHRLDDDEHGRVIRIEDELEDIVGPDGDIIDLIERVEALERGELGGEAVDGPGATAAMERADEAHQRLKLAEATIAALRTQVATLQAALESIVARVEAGVGTVPGPLTVAKGGIHVAQGGVQVHELEGRVPGASRRDGPLLVNPKSGGDLVVGNKESGGVLATGAVRGGRAIGHEKVVAMRASGADTLQPGDVVAVETKKKLPSVHRARPGEQPVGVVVKQGGLEVGEGSVAVAMAGLAPVRVRGGVRPGGRLASAGDGFAHVGEGPVLGRALGASAGDSGTVDVLLFAP
ncbi:MAG: hypothetical protein FJ102_21955 [Deltaproteobacteria bacterium]|nr:hypothetical protein [Deltaproteobacteria bacterium]